MRALPAFPAGGTSFLGSKFVRRAPRVSGLTALAAGFPSLFGREFMCGALGVCRSPALAGDRTLLGPVHCCKTSKAFFCHGMVLSRELKLK